MRMRPNLRGVFLGAVGARKLKVPSAPSGARVALVEVGEGDVGGLVTPSGSCRPPGALASAFGLMGLESARGGEALKSIGPE